MSLATSHASHLTLSTCISYFYSQYMLHYLSICSFAACRPFTVTVVTAKTSVYHGSGMITFPAVCAHDICGSVKEVYTETTSLSHSSHLCYDIWHFAFIMSHTKFNSLVLIKYALNLCPIHSLCSHHEPWSFHTESEAFLRFENANYSYLLVYWMFFCSRYYKNINLEICCLYFAKTISFMNFVLFAGSKAPSVGHKDCGKMNLHHSITEKKVLTEIKSTWRVTFSVFCLQTSCMLSSHVPRVLTQLYFKK